MAVLLLPLTNTLDKGLRDLYYAYSPSVANFIAKHDTLQVLVRWSPVPFVGVSWVTVHFGSGAALALVVLLLGLMSATGEVAMTRMRLRRQA